jgi:hypothetical protein
MPPELLESGPHGHGTSIAFVFLGKGEAEVEVGAGDVSGSTTEAYYLVCPNGLFGYHHRAVEVGIDRETEVMFQDNADAPRPMGVSGTPDYARGRGDDYGVPGAGKIDPLMTP